MAAVMMPLSTFAPRIVERIGVRPTLITGTALFGLGSAVMAIMVSADGGYLSILPGLMILGAGMGLAMTPSTTAITESLPVEKQGVASALNDTVRELGGALGVAVLGSLLNSGYRSSIAATANALPEAVQAPVREGIGTALAASAQLGGKGAAVAEAAKVAFRRRLAHLDVGLRRSGHRRSRCSDLPGPEARRDQRARGKRTHRRRTRSTPQLVGHPSPRSTDVARSLLPTSLQTAGPSGLAVFAPQCCSGVEKSLPGRQNDS